MKPILINGFGRSGTTYLFFQLEKNFPRKVIYEPLNPYTLNIIGGGIKLEEVHSYFSSSLLKKIRENYIKNFGEKIFHIIKNFHPNIQTHHRLIYNLEELKRYLLFFKDFHIKETVLFFYLDEEFIKENWDPYLIIRHPVDTYISWLKAFKIKERKLFKLNLLRPLFCILSYFINYKFIDLYYNYDELRKLYNLKRAIYLEEIFVAVWALSNYYAVKSLSKDRIIIYEKLKTYKRLPFELKDPLRIKIYPKAREDLAYEFEKIAKKWDLEEEYNYLLRFFD